MSHNGYATDADGIITSPGKFEGEPFWAPDVYDMEPNDETSEEGEGWYGLYLDYPIPDYPAVILYERSDGFVFSTTYTEPEDAQSEFDRIARELDGVFSQMRESAMRCDSCDAMMIQGVFCHETGCPNARKVYVDGEWVAPDNDD